MKVDHEVIGYSHLLSCHTFPSSEHMKLFLICGEETLNFLATNSSKLLLEERSLKSEWCTSRKDLVHVPNNWKKNIKSSLIKTMANNKG